MMPTNSNIKCFIALALVVCASLVASLPAASDPDTVVPEAALLTESSGPCAGLESAVGAIIEAAKASGTHPNWGDSELPGECKACLGEDNDGCGLQAPGGSEGHPDAKCIECIMECDYVKEKNCGPGKDETEECSMDLIGQHCGGPCGSVCSDPEGSGGKSSGGEGSFGGICDHVDPNTEFGNRKCCEENDRHEQNTCILADIGPCDNMSPKEEPCCGEQTHSDQAKCYCAKTSPDENPCCALSTHEGQAACAAYMIHHQTDNSILDGGNIAQPAFMSFAQTSGSH